MRIGSLAVCWLALAVAGCGGVVTAPVGGKVTWKNKPVETGIISFQTNQGPASMGEIVDGKYRLAGERAVRIGSAKVSIEVMNYEGEQLVAPGKKEKVYRQVAPAKYNTASTLKVDVENKENQFDFDLNP